MSVFAGFLLGVVAGWVVGVLLVIVVELVV